MSKFRQTLKDALPAAGVLAVSYLPTYALFLNQIRREAKRDQVTDKQENPQGYLPHRTKKF